MSNNGKREMKTVAENKAPALEDVIGTEVGKLNELARVDNAVAEVRQAEERADETAIAPRYQFVTVAQHLAESIVEAAQIQFNEAEANLKEAKAYADQLRDSITAKSKELADVEARLRTFGQSVIDAHNKFHRNGEQ